jgi:hypothetical protein
MANNRKQGTRKGVLIKAGMEKAGMESSSKESKIGEICNSRLHTIHNREEIGV